MADDDDDEIFVCCATLATFARAYLFEQSGCNIHLAVMALYKICPTQQTVNAIFYLLKTKITVSGDSVPRQFFIFLRRIGL